MKGNTKSPICICEEFSISYEPVVGVDELMSVDSIYQ